MDTLFTTDEQLYAALGDHYLRTVERHPGEKEGAYRARVNANVCDIVRYLLPIGTLTNLGITMNGRTAAHMVKKLLAQPLPEAQAVGREIQGEVQKVLPTLLKYSESNLEYQRDTPELVRDWVLKFGRIPALEKVRLRDPEPGAYHVAHDMKHADDAYDRIGAAIMYEYAPTPVAYGELLHHCRLLPRHDLIELLQRYTQNHAFTVRAGTSQEAVIHDELLRAFEDVHLTTEFIGGYGAWRDLQVVPLASRRPPVPPTGKGGTFEMGLVWGRIGQPRRPWPRRPPRGCPPRPHSDSHPWDSHPWDSYPPAPVSFGILPLRKLRLGGSWAAPHGIQRGPAAASSPPSPAPQARPEAPPGGGVRGATGSGGGAHRPGEAPPAEAPPGVAAAVEPSWTLSQTTTLRSLNALMRR